MVCRNTARRWWAHPVVAVALAIVPVAGACGSAEPPSASLPEVTARVPAPAPDGSPPGPSPGITAVTPRDPGAVCLGREPASAADYQRVFAARDVWSGGDIGASVDLGDGRVLWLFGDTFVDGLGPGGQPGRMLRNSLVVQQAGCFSLVASGPPGDRHEPLPAITPGEWLWPSGGVVDPAGVVKVTALRMVHAPGEPGWDWRINGVDVVALRTSDFGLVSARHADVSQDGEVKWGGGTFTAGPYVYIYGWRKDHQIVARTTFAAMDAAPWEFLTAGGWSTDRERAVQPGIEQAPAAEFWVIPHDGGYLASAKTVEMSSDDVSTWWGPTPVGPFRHVGRAARTEGPGSPWITYAGRVTGLPGAGLVTVWSRNYRKQTAKMDARFYGPQFAPPLPTAVP
jgi:hypothetical protein